jgi:mRNA-degrading endonuclease RelE of RelBE toxin-antitoxin system
MFRSKSYNSKVEILKSSNNHGHGYIKITRNSSNNWKLKGYIFVILYSFVKVILILLIITCIYNKVTLLNHKTSIIQRSQDW